MTTRQHLGPSSADGTRTIGIVIPAHNEEDFIQSTLHSLTYQRFPEGRRLDPASYEIVVVETAATMRQRNECSTLPAPFR
jgi:cellulose synthase/poly-beta-1,6-N-acetylglucosamine synthase-like glycosyltransferase